MYYSYPDTSNRLSSAGSWSYTYDENGNLVSTANGEQTITYDYDFRNNLIQVTKGDTTSSFLYNMNEERVKKSESIGGVTQETYYLYGAGRVLCEYNETGELIAKYIYANGKQIAKLVRTGETFTPYYYHLDRLGSIRLITDGDKEVVKRYKYYAFGGLNSESGTFENTYRFTGKEWDDSPELYYYGARYYDPRIGRFISPDPIPSGNSYAYCYNNPVNCVDPSGMVPAINRMSIGQYLEWFTRQFPAPAWDFELRTTRWERAMAGLAVARTPFLDASGEPVDWFWIFELVDRYGLPYSLARTARTLIESGLYSKSKVIMAAKILMQNPEMIDHYRRYAGPYYNPFFVLKYVWAGPNTLIGVSLGILSFDMPRFVEGAMVFESKSGFMAVWQWATGGRFDAFTLGHVILGHGTFEGPGRGTPLEHELVHVEQYEVWGVFFLPAYMAELITHGYENNYFERLAREMSGY